MFFAIISQHNWEIKCINKNGKEYKKITHYVPDTVDEARYLHEQGKLKLVESDSIPGCLWGHGVYEYDKWGYNPQLVKADWDSSG